MSAWGGLGARVAVAFMATGCMGVCALGCGTAGRQASTSSVAGSTGGNTGDYASTITTSSIPLGQALRGDGDVDNPGDIDGNGDRDYTSQGGKDGDSDGPTRESYDFPDSDDRATFAYGHRPSTTEARAISGVVRMYYAAASAGDGSAACGLLLPSFASSLPESYGGPGGPSYLRGGSTCAAIMSGLFRTFRSELGEAITVVEVRVAGDRAQVVIGSRRMRASSISLARAGGAWKVADIIGQPLP